MATTQVNAADLLRELDEVWGSMGKEQSETGGVLRACAMTLIALVEDNSHPIDVGETLAELMHDHPSRAIVVRVAGQDKAPLEARAFAQCWMPFGRRQQICCEQIEIRSTHDSLGNVPAILRGLLVPDLPVVLWVRSPNLIRNPSFHSFTDLAQKVIVESQGFGDWKQLMSEVQSLSTSGQVVADLAWTRITRWRELIFQAFENAERISQIHSIQTVVIRHSSPEPGPAATYLGTWLRQIIGESCSLHFEVAGNTQTWQIQQVELTGPQIHVSIQRTASSVVDILVNDLKTCAVFRTLKESDLLREELSIPGKDSTFVKVMG